MIAITDYDTGNLRSVANALRRIGAEFTVTSDAAVLRQADRVLLPGVGEASSAMAKLRERGLDALIPTLTQPVLGICIGMQLMCLDSEEGDTRCLGIFPAHVVRLRGGENPLKIPHVGWDTVGRLRSPERHRHAEQHHRADCISFHRFHRSPLFSHTLGFPHAATV